MTYTFPLLMRRFFYLYAATGLLCFLLLNSYNVLVDGSTLTHIMKYDVYWVLLECTVTVLLLQAFTYLQLRPLKLDPLRQDNRERLRLLFHLPMRLFWFVTACGLVISAVYHTIEVLVVHVRPFDSYVIQHLLIEVALSVTLGMLFYASSRRLVHPLVRDWTSHVYRDTSSASFIHPLLLTYGSFTLVSVFTLLWTIMNTLEQGKTISVGKLSWIAGLSLVIGIILFLLLLTKFRRDVQELTDRIAKLPGRDRTDLYAQVPITSPYETGELAAAFNGMQRYLRAEHEQLEKQLRLAKQTQQRLLPSGEVVFGSYRILFAVRQGDDVHGELLDAQPLADGRFIVMAGCVAETRGMPAAVVMSAALMVFRLEVKQAQSAAELLQALNQALGDTLQGEMTVSMTIALFDPELWQVTIARAGRLPCCDSRGPLSPCDGTSAPLLGTMSDHRYSEYTLLVDPKERFVFAAGHPSERESASTVTVLLKEGQE